MNPDRSVAFVLSSMRLSGGVLVVAHFANGLAERGYRVTCVTSAGGVAPQIQELLSPQVRIRTARSALAQAASLAGKGRLSWQMARLIPTCQTVIATHTPTAVPSLIARRVLRRAPRAVWFHQDYAEMFEGRPVEQWLHRRAPRWFDRVITVSQACREEIERNTGVVALVVPQGYALANEEWKSPEPAVEAPLDGRPAWESEAPVVLYVGDRRPRKGWDDLMTALALVGRTHPNLRLAIATTRDLGPVDTPVPHEVYLRPAWKELQRLYRSCRVFVSASWWESFGRPPLEAMACGAPVVLTDSRGVREFAQDGVNCLMTPIREPAALARAIEQVLRDPSLARRLGLAGWQTAQRFTWERAVDRFVHALEDPPCRRSR